VWNHLKRGGRGGEGKKGGRIIQGHSLVGAIERAVGTAEIWRIGKGGGAELLLLREEENGMALVFDQTLCPPRTADEGAVMKRPDGGMKKLRVRQRGKLSTSLLYDHS
jgi:hypothetical protein